jgi:ornithine carbamoyltransferase
LLTLADLSVGQLKGLIRQSLVCKAVGGGKKGAAGFLKSPLEKETVALIFSKRSTRTRVASESAINALGGGALFLGKDDIQLGVNESLEDSAKIIGSMTAGIMARVGDHSEVEVSMPHSDQSY